MSLSKSKSVDDLSTIPLFATTLPNSLNGTDFAALAGLIDEEEEEREKRQQQQREARRLAKASANQPMEMTANDRSSHGPVRNSRKKNKQSFHPYDRAQSSNESSTRDPNAPTAGEAVLAMNMLGF